MSDTRTMLRDRAIRSADAVGSQDWDTSSGAGGEVDQKLAVNYDREWVRCLDANPYLRTGARSVTADSDGVFALTGLSSGSGDSRQRFHRVLTVVRANAAYHPARGRQFPDPQDRSLTNKRVWYLDGEGVVLLPLTGGSTATIKVNHLPAALTTLSADTVEISTPNEIQDQTFAEIVALETAADLLNKGGRETMESVGLRQRAGDLRTQMLGDLTRFGEGPLVMQFPDDAVEWAG